MAKSAWYGAVSAVWTTGQNKYCHNSPTLEEDVLQQAILAAINSVMSQKSDLIRQITSAMELELPPVPGGNMSLADIKQRLNALNDQTRALVAKSVRINNPGAYTSQLREVVIEAAELKERKAYIEEQRKSNAHAIQHIADVAVIMEQTPCEISHWDETLVRQLVDTVKVRSAQKITVYLRGSVQVNQEMT